MGSIVYLTNKKNGKVYAYINEKVPDRKTGEKVYRRRCIGHLDPESGLIVENRPKSPREGPSALSVGIDMFLSRIAEDCGLIQALRIAYPADWKLILTCAMYILSEDAPLSAIGAWSESNYTPFGRKVEPSDMEALMSAMDTESQEAFMRIWTKRAGDEEPVVLFTHYTEFSDQDTTGSIVSTPGMQNLPLEIAVCFGRRSGMPLSFVRNPVSSIGTAKMRSTVDRMYWLAGRPIIVIDRPYANGITADDLMERGSYLMMLPNDSGIAKRAIESNKDNIVDALNYYSRPDGGHGFVKTYRADPSDRYSTFLYYSEEDAERDMGMFFTTVEMCRTELEQGVMNAARTRFYLKFFKVQGGIESARVEMNSDRVLEYASSAGYLAAVSDVMDSHYEVMMWRERLSRCSSVFSSMRTAEDSAVLKLFTERNAEARVFLQFISFILHSAVERGLVSGSLMREFSVRSAVREMSGLMRISGFGYKQPRLTKANYRQEILLKNIGIESV